MTFEPEDYKMRRVAVAISIVSGIIMVACVVALLKAFGVL